ncbi:T9SS C-terminal target domain-containing protein, partial [Flavobacterium sp. GSN2]
MKKFYFLLLGLFLLNGVNAQIVNIPDANFKARLLASNSNSGIALDLNGVNYTIDANNNGEIEVNETINVGYLSIGSSNISSLVGISNFINLTYLRCEENQIYSLDLSGLTNLINLDCTHNNINSLNISSSNNLERLRCDYNQLTQLDVSNMPNLQELFCSRNYITSLNISGKPNFSQLDCRFNLLTTLNLSALPSLTYMECNNNQLTTLDISVLPNIGFVECGQNLLTSINIGSTELYILYCYNNSLTVLDLSGVEINDLICDNNQLSSLDFSSTDFLGTLSCSNNLLSGLDLTGQRFLQYLDCNSNPLLTTLLIKNGSIESDFLDFSVNPNLNYICADESQLTDIQNLIATYGYTNCHVNTYCNFHPGGTYYTISGENRVDMNNNGCDNSDILFPNINYNVTSGTASGNFISDTSGNYSIPVQSGTHTITPILENPSYFNVSPASVVVNFPAQTSPHTQNFCVSISAPKPDLEIVFLPLQPARPGFDAKYKIIYKNKGNTIQSGTVNLAYNDDILIYTNGSPFIDGLTTNNLSWNFTNLLPLETRVITLTLYVHSPTGTPPVNGGDILNYSTSITSAATDETPNDNTFVYNQTVVNAFDPNDKTCLEGTTISPAKVGDYVHYMIRFENTGTFPAENIVVKDMIDLAKFDISTLVPIKGSHSFVTNITAGNKVEFIFENINLPFDDANNDGYVAFKIKTKPTLVLGNTFSNTASIYFDYNFPIVTNTATTTIAVLATQDFVFSNYFSVYPNPVKDVLNITAKETIEVTS